MNINKVFFFIFVLMMVLGIVSVIVGCSSNSGESHIEYHKFSMQPPSNCAATNSNVYIIDSEPYIRYVCNQ